MFVVQVCETRIFGGTGDSTDTVRKVTYGVFVNKLLVLTVSIILRNHRNDFQKCTYPSHVFIVHFILYGRN